MKRLLTALTIIFILSGCACSRYDIKAIKTTEKNWQLLRIDRATGSSWFVRSEGDDWRWVHICEPSEADKEPCEQAITPTR